MEVEKEKKEHKRSASYPSLTVQGAYDYSCRINEHFSTTSSVNRSEIAHVFKLHENTVSRDVAACVQFGFLSRSNAEGYRLTQLFTDIFLPESEKDRKMNMIRAFGTPKLYQELITKFDGHVIPAELSNTLIKHHGITETASKSAAEIFIESGMKVGVINEARVLKYSVTMSALAKTQYAEIIEEEAPATSEEKHPLVISNTGFNNKPDKEHKEVPIHLTNNKKAFLMYPSDITEKDIKIVQHEIEGILLRIQLETDGQAETK